jgi:ABC-2 type transport system permease protein
MTALLHAEFAKLRSLRLTWGLAGLVLALAVAMPAVVAAISGTGEFPALTAGDLRELIVISGELTLGVVFALAVLGSAGEYRHTTITGSFLVTPKRGRLVSAKLVASGLVGAALALLAVAGAYAATAVMVSIKDLPVDLVTVDSAVGAAGFLTAAVLFGAIGTGLGLVLRSQTLAIAGAMMWWFVVEGVLPVLSGRPGLVDSLPVSAATSLVHAGTPVAAGGQQPWAAGLVLAGYAVVIAALGSVATRSRDIS